MDKFEKEAEKGKEFVSDFINTREKFETY